MQVHSRRFHSGVLDWERTVMSDGVFAEYGVPVIGLTPAAIDRDPAEVLRRVEAAYRAVRGRPRPPGEGVPARGGLASA